MDFLYGGNRLNIAVSRAKSLFILVASPKLFEPDCRNPEQMKLANAFCRYMEMANICDVDFSEKSNMHFLHIAFN
jgi:superfamily I DNA and/or RNA helicase